MPFAQAPECGQETVDVLTLKDVRSRGVTLSHHVSKDRMDTLMERAGGVVGKDRNGHSTVQTQPAWQTCHVVPPHGDAKTWYAVSCHI
jgi:hypothetical protein